MTEKTRQERIRERFQPKECVYKGLPVESRLCDSCNYKRSVIVYTCKIHGVCSTNNQLPGVMTCNGCSNKKTEDIITLQLPGSKSINIDPSNTTDNHIPTPQTSNQPTIEPLSNTLKMHSLRATLPTIYPRDIQWAYGITTIPQRVKDLLPLTIKSLANAGFDYPTLFIDGMRLVDLQSLQSRFSLPLTNRFPRVGAYANWLLSASELLARNPQADRFAIFQDDIITYKNLKKYLESIPYPETVMSGNYRSKMPGYWNLYSSQENETIILNKQLGWYGGATSYVSKGKPITFKNQQGMISPKRNQQRGIGALALVFSRESLKLLLSQPYMWQKLTSNFNREKNIDGAIALAMNPLGIRELIHSPSLVEHTGEVSYANPNGSQYKRTKTFKGEEFDAMNFLKF